MRIGFAGLGRMGIHMARNLAETGRSLTVWNRTRARADMLARETGCAVATTPRALADRSDVVFTMLADDPSSEAVHFGRHGLYAGKPPSHFVEMGTMSPGHIASLAEAAPRGSTVIDAPVSGATEAAKTGALLIMAGCSESAAETLKPLFAAIGRQTVYLERTGAGAVMKLAVNSLIHGLNQALAEAMTLAEAAGISPQAAFDVIEASAAGAPMLRYRRPLYLEETAHDVTFTIALARKDMEITAALAERLGTPMPQGHVTLDTLRKAEEEGYASRDMASILDFMRKDRR